MSKYCLYQYNTKTHPANIFTFSHWKSNRRKYYNCMHSVYYDNTGLLDAIICNDFNTRFHKSFTSDTYDYDSNQTYYH